MAERVAKKSRTISEFMHMLEQLRVCICCGKEARYTQMCHFCRICEACFLECKHCGGKEVCCCLFDNEYGPLCGPNPSIRTRQPPDQDDDDDDNEDEGE